MAFDCLRGLSASIMPLSFTPLHLVSAAKQSASISVETTEGAARLTARFTMSIEKIRMRPRLPQGRGCPRGEAAPGERVPQGRGCPRGEAAPGERLPQGRGCPRGEGAPGERVPQGRGCPAPGERLPQGRGCLDRECFGIRGHN
jgi:hypothetical protein